MDGALEQAVRSWAAGWAATRGIAPPTMQGRVLLAHVASPERTWELIVLPPADRETVSEAAARARREGSGTWLTVVAPDLTAARAVAARARLVPVAPGRQTFMAADLAPGGHRDGGEADTPTNGGAGGCTGESVEENTTDRGVDVDGLPAGYRGTVRRAGGRTVVEVHSPAGGPAARGVGAVVGQHLVLHSIATDPGHRRRGLGRAVVRALVVAGIAQGAHTGLLVASDEGGALYRSMGWRVLADVGCWAGGPGEDASDAAASRATAPPAADALPAIVTPPIDAATLPDAASRHRTDDASLKP